MFWIELLLFLMMFTNSSASPCQINFPSSNIVWVRAISSNMLTAPFSVAACCERVSGSSLNCDAAPRASARLCLNYIWLPLSSLSYYCLAAASFLIVSELSWVAAQALNFNSWNKGYCWPSHTIDLPLDRSSIYSAEAPDEARFLLPSLYFKYAIIW